MIVNGRDGGTEGLPKAVPLSEVQGIGIRARLELNDKRCRDEQRAYDTEPHPALDKAGIDAEQDAGNHRREFRLPPSVDEVRRANRAGDDTEE